MLKGVIPVVPTPLKEDESLDLTGLKRLVNYYIENGCHGILVLGSGGEFPYFSFEEKLEIVKTACEAADGRIKLLVGCGFYSLTEIKKFISALSGLPLNGLLVALPTYYRPEFEDVLNYYKSVCCASEWPVLYYHYPQMTGLHLSEVQIQRLADIENLCGAKVSSLCVKEMKYFCNAAGDKEFDIFAGVSFLMKETIKTGGKGVICPVASIAPRLVVDCYNAYINGDMQLADSLQRKVFSFICVTNSFKLPAKIQAAAFRLVSRLPLPLKNIGTAQRHAVIKEALNLMNLGISSKVRSPLLQLKPSDKKVLEGFITNVACS